jgi:hypothetical protein
MQRKILAVDADDVLVNVTPKWVWKAKQSRELSRLPGLSVLPDDKPGIRAATLGRDVYMLHEWLGVPPEHMPEFMSIYNDDGEFYDGLPPTPFAIGIIKSCQVQGVVDQVHVLTHVLDQGGGASSSKERWLRRYLQPDRLPVAIHQVPSNEKKSAWMRRHCPRPDSFADDAIRNVLDVLVCDHVKPSQILMPRLGHNSPVPGEMAVLAALRQITIEHYGNVHSPAGDL